MNLKGRSSDAEAARVMAEIRQKLMSGYSMKSIAFDLKRSLNHVYKLARDELRMQLIWLTPEEAAGILEQRRAANGRKAA